MILSEEPYSALLLLFNLHSGHFLSRVWNQTVTRGRATALEQLVEACQRHFVDGGRQGGQMTMATFLDRKHLTLLGF